LTTKVIFMGTPEFAVPSLTALIKSSAYQLVAVVTQPDRPSGRGHQLTPSPIKQTAVAAGLPILQSETLRPPEIVAQLAALQPDVIVVAAFGQILRQEVLTMPPFGCVNVHASLLPRWRGAAPIAAAIQAGDAESGITLMQMDVGLDTGPMLAKRAIALRPDHTTENLTHELAELGAALLIETLPAWLAGQIIPEPQDNTLATLAPRLKKEAGAIDWQQSAVIIEHQVRAFHPWPGTFTSSLRGAFKVLQVALAPHVTNPYPDQPGTVFKHQKEVYVTTGEGVLHLMTVQPPSKKPMPAIAMLNGQPELWDKQLGIKN